MGKDFIYKYLYILLEKYKLLYKVKLFLFWPSYIIFSLLLYYYIYIKSCN